MASLNAITKRVNALEATITTRKASGKSLNAQFNSASNIEYAICDACETANEATTNKLVELEERVGDLKSLCV